MWDGKTWYNNRFYSKNLVINDFSWNSFWPRSELNGFLWLFIYMLVVWYSNNFLFGVFLVCELVFSNNNYRPKCWQNGGSHLWIIPELPMSGSIKRFLGYIPRYSDLIIPGRGLAFRLCDSLGESDTRLRWRKQRYYCTVVKMRIVERKRFLGRQHGARAGILTVWCWIGRTPGPSPFSHFIFMTM